MKEIININYSDHLNKQGFELIKKIGIGASGGTYLAHQKSLNRDVAVKFFDSEFYKNNPVARKRFVREASILAQLQHPNIPYVITTGEVTTEKVPYFIMQFIEGTTLEQMIKSRKVLTSSECITVTLQILKALEFVHSKDMLHRDIKPSNIMITHTNQCFLIDFSIGVALDNESDGLTRATTLGHKVGTPPYAAPEQLSNAVDADQRSDIYSLGVVMLNMLTGSTNLPDASKPIKGVSQALIAVMVKACDINVNNRFQESAEFTRELSIDSSKLNLPREHPSSALCVNLKCPSADWSTNGYYRGPFELKNSTDTFCPECGSDLLYQCPKCTAQLNLKPYCGSCGHENFKVPICKKCDSFLTNKFMDKKTEETGCEKCIRQNRIPIPTTNFEDDIPF